MPEPSTPGAMDPRAPSFSHAESCRFDHDGDGDCHVHPDGCQSFLAKCRKLADAIEMRPEELRGFRPLHDGVLIRQRPPERLLGHGLIFAADKHKPWAPEGIVLAIGPGLHDEHGARIPMSVEVGDRVLFERRPSSELEAFRQGDDVRFLLLRDGDIVAILAREGIEVRESEYGTSQLHRRDAL